MTVLIVVGLVVFLVVAWRVFAGNDEAAPPTPPTPIRPPAPPATIRTRARMPEGPRTGSTPAGLAAVPPPEARPGRTRLFGMGAPGSDGYAHEGPYAVVGFTTTGFTPVRDRIIDLAVLHTDARGRVEGQWSSHLNVGSTPVPLHLAHLMSNAQAAPSFARIAPHLLALFEGRVVVAHHATFLEQFLDAHLMEAGILAPSHPALCTFELARSTFPTRNQRLLTLAHHARSSAVPGRSAVDDAHAVTALLPAILDRHGKTLRYPCPADGDPDALLLAEASPLATGNARPDPWLVGIFARASGLARELNDARVASFLDILVAQLLQGRIVIDEVRDLTRLLVAAGYSADDLRGVQERLLESLRRAAYEEKRPVGRGLHHLRATAASVGIPGYFDDLIPPPAPKAPEPGSGSFSRPVRKPLPPKPPPHLPRCGHCLEIGHYTSACPRRERGPVRAINPI